MLHCAYSSRQGADEVDEIRGDRQTVRQTCIDSIENTLTGGSKSYLNPSFGGQSNDSYLSGDNEREPWRMEVRGVQ